MEASPAAHGSTLRLSAEAIGKLHALAHRGSSARPVVRPEAVVAVNLLVGRLLCGIIRRGACIARFARAKKVSRKCIAAAVASYGCGGARGIDVDPKSTQSTRHVPMVRALAVMRRHLDQVRAREGGPQLAISDRAGATVAVVVERLLVEVLKGVPEGAITGRAVLAAGRAAPGPVLDTLLPAVFDVDG